MDKPHMELMSTIFFSTFHCKHTKAGPRVTKFCSDKNTKEMSGACIEETGYKQNYLL